METYVSACMHVSSRHLKLKGRVCRGSSYAALQHCGPWSAMRAPAKASCMCMAVQASRSGFGPSCSKISILISRFLDGAHGRKGKVEQPEPPPTSCGDRSSEGHEGGEGGRGSRQEGREGSKGEGDGGREGRQEAERGAARIHIEIPKSIRRS